MAVGSADVHKAINTAWYEHGLDWAFKSIWQLSARDDYISLNDSEAAPSQPFPYCVYTVQSDSVAARMTSSVTTQKRIVRDYPCEFNVHARLTDGSGKTAKQIAADLAAEIMGVFGGHPTIKPKELTLDNGCFVVVQLLANYGEKTGDDEHMWTLSYAMQVDVPETP